MNRKITVFLKRQWKEWRGLVLFFLFVVIPVKSCIADWNWVPSGSMNPTIVEGDLVYVDKLAYDFRFPLTLHSMKHIGDPQRGDISVLFSPEDGTRLVKRVIGLPGDEIAMHNNSLIINGEPVDYAPLSAEQTDGLQADLRNQSLFAEEDIHGHKHAVMSVPAVRTPGRNFSSIVVPEGHYFVMGDNRDLSKDSRIFGMVERKQFVGRAESVIVSFNMLDWYQPRLNRFFTSLN